MINWDCSHFYSMVSKWCSLLTFHNSHTQGKKLVIVNQKFSWTDINFPFDITCLKKPRYFVELCFTSSDSLINGRGYNQHGCETYTFQRRKKVPSRQYIGQLLFLQPWTTFWQENAITGNGHCAIQPLTYKFTEKPNSSSSTSIGSPVLLRNSFPFKRHAFFFSQK